MNRQRHQKAPQASPFYRIPTRRELDEYFESHCDTGLAWGVLTGKVDPSESEDFPKTNRWIRQCWHRPSDLEIAMHALDEVLECYGVETGTTGVFGAVSFLNSGDTYNPTLIECGRYITLSTVEDLREVCELSESKIREFFRGRNP